MEAVLWLIKRVYFILTHPLVRCITMKNQTGHFVPCLSKRINGEQNCLQNLIKLLLIQALLSGQMQEGSFPRSKRVTLAIMLTEQDFQILKIEELMCDIHAGQKRENKHCFLKIFSSVRLLARQSESLRGHSNDSNSNFIQLLKLRPKDDAVLQKWLEKKANK